MNQSMSLLPLMPFDPAWVEQSQAFHHPDPRMVKAALKLLFASWRGLPVGSIPASHTYIAETTGLPPEVVAERYVALTDGFELREDGRLHHGRLATICAKMIEGYGTEIDAYTVSLAMVGQDPEQFSLLSVEAGKAGSKIRGKCQLPKGFGFEAHPELRNWCFENQYPAPNQQKNIMDKFLDYAAGRGEKQKDWPATFRTYARKEIEYGRMPPPPQWPDGHPSANSVPQPPPTFPGRSNAFTGLNRGGTRAFQSKGEQAADHNQSVMAAARDVMSRAPRG